MQVYDSVSAVNLPALEDGQLYLYVLETRRRGILRLDVQRILCGGCGRCPGVIPEGMRW